MSNMPYTALIGLGGNMGDVRAHMRYACKRLAEAKHSQFLEQFPKSVTRFSGKNCGKNKELEQFVEPSETKTALEQFLKSRNRFSGKNCDKTQEREHFQQKWVPVLRRKMRKNKEQEHFAEPSEAKNSLVVSSLYRTPPWGKTDQPWFLNAAAALTTTLTPQKFLDFCLAIERECLRDRRERWGPRTLDIDLLFFIDNLQKRTVQINDAHLTLPHPRIKERAFVLLPLCDIAPDVMLEGKAVSDWLALLSHNEIEKMAEPQDWWQTTP